MNIECLRHPNNGYNFRKGATTGNFGGFRASFIPFQDHLLIQALKEHKLSKNVNRVI